MKRFVKSGLMSSDLAQVAPFTSKSRYVRPTGCFSIGKDVQAASAPARGMAQHPSRHATLSQPRHASLGFPHLPHPSASPTVRAGAGTAACGLDSVPGAGQAPALNRARGIGRWLSSALLVAAFLVVPPPAGAAGQDTVTTLPQTPVHDCRGGRARLYNECHPQVDIFDAALRTARSQDKVLLVSFGAEWCIWCHVFHAYLTGGHGAFTHNYAAEHGKERYSATIHERAAQDPSDAAAELAAFAAETFVLVHIDNRYAEDGFDVLDDSGALSAYQNALPFIFTVDADGRFVAAFDPARAETRRDSGDWFRGYDRAALRAELERMKEAAE